MSELFPEQEMLKPSPKLDWLRRHDLRTALDVLPRTYIGPFNSKPWVCSNKAQTICGFGDTELEAIDEYCRITGCVDWAMEESVSGAPPIPTLDWEEA